MPFIVPALVAELWRLRYLVLAIGLAVAALWFVHHERAVGAQKIKVAVAAAAAQEHDRRQQVLVWAQQWAAGAIGHVNQLDEKNGKLAAENARLAAAHDRDLCLDRGAVERLRQLVRPAPGR